MNCNTTHYRANSSSVPGDPTDDGSTDASGGEGSSAKSAAGAADAAASGGEGSEAANAAAGGAGQAGEAAPEGGAGSAGEIGGAGGQGSTEVSDTTPPEIVSITPTNGTTGVTKSSPIVVTFNESMDKASAEGAFAVAELGKNYVATWDAAGTVMTVYPLPSLEYAHGTDNSVTAKSYTVSVGTGAKDAAGNALTTASSSTFSTLREISVVLSDPTPKSFAESGQLLHFYVGDQASDFLGFKGLTKFDITAIPEGVTAIESASFEVVVNWISSLPFESLGSLNVDHFYSSVFDTSCYSSPALASLGVLATSASAGSTLTLDVTAAVQDDYANRADRSNQSQYRLQFALETDSDYKSDFIEFGGNGTGTAPRLDVTYLIP